MKKKLLAIILLISCTFILSGCGETQEDKINSTDPKKFAIASFKEKYDKDIDVTFHETKYFKYTATQFNYEYEIYKFKLKDDDTIYKIATYWEVSNALPTKHYVFRTNYENLVSKKILEEYFEEKNIKLLSYQDEIKKYSYLELYRFTIKPDNIDNIVDILYDLSRKEELYPVSLKINYNNKKVTVDLNKDIEKSAIEKKIKGLK